MNISVFLHWRWHRVLLLAGTALSSVALIVLNNRGVLPLDSATFFFFCFVYFLFSLYRPGWSFLLCIGLLPLETINLSPSIFGGIMFRPYQGIAALLLLAIAIRFLLGRLPFQMFRPRLIDTLPLLIIAGSFLGVINAPVFSVALKQALVVTSFVALYFLGRIFFRTLYDVKQAAPFFLVSSLVVFGYALWQNIQYRLGFESFQVMIGRPNATFSEADWLGLFGIVALGVGMGLLLDVFDIFSKASKKRAAVRWRYFTLGLYISLVFVVLLLSVARSAWLGSAVVGEVSILAVLLSYGIRNVRFVWKKTVYFVGIIVGAFVLACGVVAYFQLSPFQFWNRIQSTGSGWQKITVACDSADTALPEKLVDMSDLERNNCRHIALEMIDEESRKGHFIREVYRDDPNVTIRKDIYQKSWTTLQSHPILGIGWGSISQVLGKDDRGSGLNASNVVLEVWLGSGLVGISAFLAWWFLIIYAAIRRYRQSVDHVGWVYAVFILSSFAGIAVFNLFNSGILLGFYFILFSIGALLVDEHFDSLKR